MRIAIIPARGGSERIPRKNIRQFFGQAVIGYPIDAALRSSLFSDGGVWVSTDDREIADIAHTLGALVMLRPPELADERTGTQAVVRHAILKLQEESKRKVEHVCCIYPTTPMLTAADLHAGYRALDEHRDAPYAFPVSEFDSPVQRALIRWATGRVGIVWPQFSETRSQDLEPRWRDAGQYYWGKAEAFLNDVPIYSSNSVGVPMPRWKAIDIDTEEDWHIASLMYHGQRWAPPRGHEYLSEHEFDLAHRPGTYPAKGNT